MPRRTLLAFTAVLALVACAPSVDVTTTNLGGSRPRSTPSGNVRVFAEREAVPSSYTDIALLVGSGEHSDDEIIEAMVDKARELGADGIVLLDRSTEQAGGVFSYGVYIASTVTTIRAAAIVFD